MSKEHVMPNSIAIISSNGESYTINLDRVKYIRLFAECLSVWFDNSNIMLHYKDEEAARKDFLSVSGMLSAWLEQKELIRHKKKEKLMNSYRTAK